MPLDSTHPRPPPRQDPRPAPSRPMAWMAPWTAP